MHRHSVFALIFSSWIFGISLICLFPPVPDYDRIDQNSGYLSQDSFPEIHQRNASQTSVFQMDFGIDIIESFVGFNIGQALGLSKKACSIGSLSQASTFFDSWILFEAFFETW